MNNYLQILLFASVLSSTLLTIQDGCCSKKAVNDVIYNLVDKDVAVPDVCKDKCVYTASGQPSENLYCFKHGSYIPKCYDNTTSGQIATGTEYSENGVTYTQQHLYNPKTKEAIIRVPAHGDYGDNSYIVLGNDADHIHAGKMMSIENNTCELHDLPMDFHPQDFEKGPGQGEKVKRYVFKSNRTEIVRDSEEYNQLTDSMKIECQGLKIFKSDIEVLDENPHYDIRSSSSSKKSVIDGGDMRLILKPVESQLHNLTESRQSNIQDVCVNVRGSCVAPDSHGCYHFLDVHFYSFSQLPDNAICGKCCADYGKNTIPCQCMQDAAAEGQVAKEKLKQMFSTSVHNLYDNNICWPTPYCTWDPTSTYIRDTYNCNYLGGACLRGPDSNCYDF